MSARDERDELAAAVELLGALPMPVGLEPRTLDVVEEELTGANLSLWEEEQATARLRLALESAKRGRRELRARVAELEAERSKYVGKEPTIAEEMAYLSRCIDAVLDLCNEAERKGITSGGPFTVEAVRRAADGLEPRRSYPPTLPWAALMDDEDRAEFLGDLIDALNSNPPRTRDVLAEVEKTIAQWRLIGEAQHAHNTAPGPSVEVSADRDEPAEAPDFFQTGRTYLRFVGDRELYFRVTSVSTDNPNQPDSLAGDGPVAHGWVRTERFATVWGPGGYTDFAGWRDITESGGGR